MHNSERFRSGRQKKWGMESEIDSSKSSLDDAVFDNTILSEEDDFTNSSEMYFVLINKKKRKIGYKR